mmetsp:Transcript_20759/g.67176  ORF Transcript_20759/g.67176 Transcript_20759/m.67176 type:complete len:298 (-) Transcript_20759:425-1318(-)
MKCDIENSSSPPFSPSAYVPFGAETRQPLKPHNVRLRRRAGGIQPAGKCHGPKPAESEQATREERLLAELRVECSARYDVQEHEWMLRQLWACVRFGAASSFQANSPCWRSIGFQRDDPTTDLRGCGVIGLRQLLHFCERGGGNEVLAAVDFSVAPFPLATASFSVTLALCSHLHLLPDAASSRPVCASPILAHFLRFAAELEPARALDLLHAELLRGLAELWRSMQHPGLTLMHFPQALSLMNDHMASVLGGSQPPWQLCNVLRQVRDVGGALTASERTATMVDLCSGGVLRWMGF